MQKRGVLTNANYLQDVVHSVHLIYVARLYGVPACSTFLEWNGSERQSRTERYR